MYINNESREGIASFLKGIGMLIFLIAIFTNLIEFELGVMIAFLFFILAVIFKTWVKVDRETNRNYFRNSRAFSKLLKLLAYWIILYSIFFDDLSFNTALIIAISLFILRGVFREFFGISHKKKHRKRYYQPTTSIKEIKRKNYQSEISDFQDDGPAKLSCNNCGINVIKDDIFCSNCGERTIN